MYSATKKLNHPLVYSINFLKYPKWFAKKKAFVILLEVSKSIEKDVGVESAGNPQNLTVFKEYLLKDRISRVG